jgi:hypothetical protein
MGISPPDLRSTRSTSTHVNMEEWRHVWAANVLVGMDKKEKAQIRFPNAQTLLPTYSFRNRYACYLDEGIWAYFYAFLDLMVKHETPI